MSLTRIAIRRWAPAVAISAILATPIVASAQAVVRTVIVDRQSVSDTDRVHRSRFADLAEESRITAGTTTDISPPS